MEKQKRPSLDDLPIQKPRRRLSEQERAAINGSYMQEQQLELGIYANTRGNLGLPVNEIALQTIIKQQTPLQPPLRSTNLDEDPNHYHPDRKKKPLRTGNYLCLDYKRATQQASKDELADALQPNPLASTEKEYRDYLKHVNLLFPSQ